VGNSYVYYNDLPRLLEALAGPAAVARTGVCLRGGASLPGLVGPRGGSADALPSGDSAGGVGVGCTPVGTVRGLLLGEASAASNAAAPAAPPATMVADAETATATEGEAAPGMGAETAASDAVVVTNPGLWDAVVLNDYSQGAARRPDRARTEKCLREQYAPLLSEPRCGCRVAVLYVPPAYRAHAKGSDEIGY